MCGICGIVSKTKIDIETIRAMTDAIAHRGPDAHATYIDGSERIAFGHNRLSIIDLSAEANQPMFYDDGRLVMVFNGEIYNFKDVRKQLTRVNPSVRFTTLSDTETILAAFVQWKEEMVTRLDGMFSIVIYDKAEGKAFLFRDRLGKKPFFYYLDDDLFLFASEIKSLLKHPRLRKRTMDINVALNFLHFGYAPEPHTIFREVKKFPAGHLGILNNALQLEYRPYWKIDDFVSSINDAAIPSAGRLKETLFTAVEKRLISDVPLGAFLSGGTDSALVSAIASQILATPLKTFTIGFDEPKFDESNYARKVAHHLKTDHHEYRVTERDALELLEKCMTHFDEPFADSSALPTYLVSQLARKEVTVVLTGDGGDEFFLGYGAYDWANRLEKPWVNFTKPILKSALSMAGGQRLPRISKMFEGISNDQLRSHIFSQEQYFFSVSDIEKSLNQNVRAQYTPYAYNDHIGLASGAEKQALFDAKNYLKDDLLVKVDRASMHCALECRCPLLDHHVVELALKIPYDQKIRAGVHKWILKDILSEYLPADLVHRPKWGFGVPLARWLKNDLRYLIDRYLSDQVVSEVGIFEIEYVQLLKQEFFTKGKNYLYNRIWVLLLLHKWIKENE